jgi:hypothetical protein
LHRARIGGAAFGMSPGPEGVFILALEPPALEVAGPRDRRDDRRFIAVDELDADELRRGVPQRARFLEIGKSALEAFMLVRRRWLFPTRKACFRARSARWF